MKRVAAIRDLSDDHHTGLVLARRCRTTAQSASAELIEQMWSQVTETLQGHLEPHFSIEEQHLLPALVSIGEPELAARIEREHQEIRELAGSSERSSAALSRFGDLVRSHIRFEEREVFERVQHRLSEDQLREIAAACESIPRSSLGPEPGTPATRSGVPASR